MVTDLEQQIRELAASRLPAAPRLGTGNGPATAEDTPTPPTIFYWLSTIREQLDEAEDLARRSEDLSRTISGLADNGPLKKQETMPAPATLYTSVEMIAHRLQMANDRIRAALTASERTIGAKQS